MNIQRTTKEKGATLLMAVLMVSVVLAVGLGIYQRTYKSIIFASFLKQSQIAFAAADSGLECAMYLDLYPDASQCFGESVDEAGWPTDGNSLPLTRDFALRDANGCVNILVKKVFKDMNTPSTPGDTTDDTIITHIEARGYNDACTSTNPRRVERGLYIDY